ncbi:MAG: hypothetical protein ACOC6B_05980 [Thermodesulfobacteriota bacterium]
MIELNKQANASKSMEQEKQEIYFALLTKLLSLNAEFEAARFGGAGARFAASADEAGSSAIRAVSNRKEGTEKP